MIQIDSNYVLSSLTYLSSTHKYLSVAKRRLIERGEAVFQLPFDRFREMRACVARLREAAKMLNMTVSLANADRVDQAINQYAPYHDRLSDYALGQLTEPISMLISAVLDEMSARLLFVIPPDHASFYSEEKSLFGLEVDDAFPDIIDDVREAGKCRALGRWTASVMHLMRVLEVGLRALAAYVEVDHDSNWNTTLNQIESKLRSVRKKVDGPDAEQWAAEAGTHLRFLKNAYRNHAMHPLERYDEDRAVAIFENTKSFMRHLSEKLGSQPSV